ncbi:MAG: hypothetical protein MUO39_10935 [Steroidobacteraceae bacterium]|nr:hypothetical protein [Steroidobacteraceae bacterium]
MRALSAVSAFMLIAFACASEAQDVNLTLPVPELERMLAQDPFKIVSAEISRPKAKGDITLKAEVSFDGRPPIRVKLRKAEPGADTFNNQPRYDLAAYRLQALFLDPGDYVVPPTAVRFLPLEDFDKYSPGVKRTFSGADEALAVLQYWLQEVKVIADVYLPTLYDTDPVYARSLGQMNILTFLIEHGDSNVGNFLISGSETDRRVFSVDNGVSFAAGESDRGRKWAGMRVDSLPAATVERLRALTLEELDAQLAVVAQWTLNDGHFITTQPGAPLSTRRGVRREGAVLQMGLTKPEIERVWRNRQRLLDMVDDGKLKTY